MSDEKNEIATVLATVINLNAFGATLRLENGELACASADDVEKHHNEYERALHNRKPIRFELRASGRRPVLALIPQITDVALDEQIAAYLKSTGEWEKPDAPPAHERHFLHKKKRSEHFEKRSAILEAKRKKR